MLLRLTVYGMLAAESAVFVHFEPIRGVLFIFRGVVVSLLAFVASEGYFYSHCGTSFVIYAPIIVFIL